MSSYVLPPEQFVRIRVSSFPLQTPTQEIHSACGIRADLLSDISGLNFATWSSGPMVTCGRSGPECWTHACPTLLNLAATCVPNSQNIRPPGPHTAHCRVQVQSQNLTKAFQIWRAMCKWIEGLEPTISTPTVQQQDNRATWHLVSRTVRAESKAA